MWCLNKVLKKEENGVKTHLIFFRVGGPVGCWGSNKCPVQDMHLSPCTISGRKNFWGVGSMPRGAQRLVIIPVLRYHSWLSRGGGGDDLMGY